MAATREVLELMGQMRVAIDAAVDEASRALVGAWAQAWTALATEWEAAAAELAAAATPGPDGVARPLSRTKVLRAQRTAAALTATQDALVGLGTQAGVTVTQQMVLAVTDTATWHARLTAAQLPAAAGPAVELAVRFNRVDPAALAAIVARSTQQITALTWEISAEATAAIRAELVRSVALGKNPREGARRMVARVQRRFNGGLSRALNIARTEILDAHRASGEAQDAANADVLGAWLWLAKLDTTTCESCWAQHGSRHPLTEPGPLDHQSGRCARMPVTKTWRELGFDLDDPPSVVPDARATFAALPHAEQVAVMGPEKLRRLNAGEISWDDLSMRRSTDGWRDSYAPTPLHALPGGAPAA